MKHGDVDERSFEVRVGDGYLIGDFLKKFAIKGPPSWQIAGYQLDSQDTGFGIGNGAMGSSLELLRGKLVPTRYHEPGEPKFIRFTWDGKNFVSDGYELRGLNKSVGETLKVCLVYASGVRKCDRNFEVCKLAAGGIDTGIVAVPSTHTSTCQFRFDVNPINDKKEKLTIWADASVLNDAYQNAVMSLSGLNI